MINREEIVEAMAECAHLAWECAHRAQGITSRLAPWGEEFMVSYDEMSERGKEFDRVIMRAILDAFDKVGLKVVRVDAADRAAEDPHGFVQMIRLFALLCTGSQKAAHRVEGALQPWLKIQDAKLNKTVGL